MDHNRKYALPAASRTNSNRMLAQRRHQPQKMAMLQTKAPTMLGHYRIEDLIGKGSLGSVHSCMNTKTLRKFAIKTISTQSMNAQQREDVQTEAKLMASLPPHENIIKYIDTVNTDKRFFCIVTEYVAMGSLRKILDYNFETDDSLGLPEEIVASHIQQILRGVLFLHQHTPQSIIHRDIKAVELECALSFTCALS